MAEASPLPLDIKPGIIRQRGPGSSGGRWIDGDKVRFWLGLAEKIGGWQKALNEQFEGLVRGMFAWTSVAGVDHTSFGTATKLYSYTDDYDDITPLDAEGALTNPFSTTSGSPIVNVFDVAHGRAEGAVVIFDNATAVGGITIDGEYTVTTVVDTDNYTITHSVNAGSTAGPGGGTVDFEYELNPGLSDTVYGLGWGSGAWGEGTWGTPREGASGIPAEMRYWHFARYGSHLMTLPSGGKLYLWDEPSSADRAEVVAGAPTQSRAMFVTAERFPVLLGTQELTTGEFNPMHVRWANRDDITDWTPSPDDEGNARTMQAGNKLMAGTVFTGINLFWSDTALYLMQYLPGSDFIYDTRVIASRCGLLSPGGFAVTPVGVFWWTSDTFYFYSGDVGPVPRVDEIVGEIFPIMTNSVIPRRLNRAKAYKCFAGYNRRANEVLFGYPSGNSDECDRYVAVALEDFSWHFGTLERTGMTHNPRPNGTVIMAGGDSYLYEHEVGKDADGQPMEVYIQSDVVSLGNGAADADIEGYVPVFDRHIGDVELTLFVQDRQMSPSYLEETTFTIAEGDTLIDVYMGGRYAGHRLSSNVLGGDFRLGIPILQLGPAGEAR